MTEDNFEQDVGIITLPQQSTDNLPAHWSRVRLLDEELFAFENGIWTGKKPPFVSCPVIRNTNFTDEGLLHTSDIAVILIEQRQLDRKKLAWGDIIIERSGGGPQQPVGRVVFFDLKQGTYCFSNFTTRLRVVNKAHVDPYYLHFYLLYFHSSGQTEKMQNRTTGIRNLAFEEYKKCYIPLPPLFEQRAIAHVLQTVQETIQARRREVELERERKAALMQQLFTYGIWNEPTKETEIGEVPQSWQVVRLRDLIANGNGILQTGPFGSQLHASDYKGVGIPVVNPTHLGFNTIVEDYLPRISHADAERLSRHYLVEGDILISRRGDFSRYSYITEKYSSWLCGTGCLLIRLQNALVDNYFVSISIGSEVVQGFFAQNAKGSIMPNLNTDILSNLPLALPSISEQHQIARILQACDNKTITLERELSLLEELFNTLLEELMTGRFSTISLIKKEIVQ